MVGAVAALALFSLCWLRHARFWSGFDLAIFDQAAWQLAHGRSHISIVDRHVLADHFSPVLLAFAPLYRVAATPAWLLGAQAVAVGATVLPLRSLARHLGIDVRWATFLCLASAPLLAAAWFDFHPSTIAVPFVAATVLHAVRDEPRPAGLAAVAVALCRADLAPTLLAVALVAGPRSRRRLALVAVIAGAVGAFAPGLFGETNGWSPHFGHLGTGPVDAVLHPWRVAGELLSVTSLAVLALWVLAGGLLVVLKPRWLAALVVAGLPVLLSRWTGTETPWYHYGAPMAPLAIGGSLVAMGAVRAGGAGMLAGRVGALVGGASVAVLVAASPLSPAAPAGSRVWQVADGSDAGTLASLAREVREGERASVAGRLLPHVSQRRSVHLFPVPYGIPEGFFAPGAEPDLDAQGDDAVDVVVAPTARLGIVPEGHFEVVTEAGGYTVLRRPEPAPDPARANMRSHVGRPR